MNKKNSLSTDTVTYTVALAGNPNVGKSSLFNRLTGLHQHTGNWPGKTVSGAQGTYVYHGALFRMIDTPGTYSLSSNSAEEEVAEEFLCFGQYDVCAVVVDATALERNLFLVLQLLERTKNIVLCLNMADEAAQKGIRIDEEELSLQLGIPVVKTSARTGLGLEEMQKKIAAVANRSQKCFSVKRPFQKETEERIAALSTLLQEKNMNGLPPRWAAIKLLEKNSTFCRFCAPNLINDPDVVRLVNGADEGSFRDTVTARYVSAAEEIAARSLCFEKDNYRDRDLKIDRLLTSRRVGIPLMMLLLGLIFWITIEGANYPSDLLSRFLFDLEEPLLGVLTHLQAPAWITEPLIYGMYRTLAWVVSVMLPPMAIFFPLFTLLEDVGYLPRVAFTCDRVFRKAGAHGKQALTMCMGFGCNACGVIGARIIDSPRERLIAALTNSLVPCNGRFPALISLISLFLVGRISGVFRSLTASVMLFGFVFLGMAMTLLLSRLLSHTLLKGQPSSFALELPPYRKPQLFQILVRSVLDRTLSVLGRAVCVAAPAGLLLWVLSNVTVGDASCLQHITSFFDPFASLFGMDGTIMTAFLLGFPANETVIPIMMMAYAGQGYMQRAESSEALRLLFLQNGWTLETALCTTVFFLFHFPCATTTATVYRETKSVPWTLLAFCLPTALGLLLCFLIHTVFLLL